MKNKIEKILQENPQGLKAKEIARLLSVADRKTVNQILYANPSLFVVNGDYEWTLKHKTSPAKKREKPSKKSAEEIKALFADAEIEPDDLAILEKLSDRKLRSISERYQALERYTYFSWDKDNCFGFVFHQALVKSENDFTNILNRTKQIRDLYYINDFELWASIIFSASFDVILSHAQELFAYDKSAEYMWHGTWLKIVLMSPAKFNAFMNNLKSLSAIAPDIVFRNAIRLVLSDDFKKIYNRALKLKELSAQGMFPLVVDWDYDWEGFIKLNDRKFNTCLARCRKIFGSDPHIIDALVSQKDKKQARFLEVVLLSETAFNNLFCNLTLCSQLPIVQPLSDDEWFAFYSQSQQMFIQEWQRTKKLNEAVGRNELPLLAVEDWKAYMSASQSGFESKFALQKQEHQTVLEKLRIKQKVIADMRNGIGFPNKTSFKQCFGDCSTCKREKCVLEED